MQLLIHKVHMRTNAADIAKTEKDLAFIPGVSPPSLTLEGVVAEIAATNIPVLLTGESGTGKQMIAHRIHLLSPRSDAPFVKIACASMTSETFAHQLGIRSNGDGITQVGATGTVFFDEIGELDAACQRTLLCALPDDDASPRLGMVAARVISSTNRNLEDEMRAGRFRSELYYRINGVCLRLPPLRDRREDIPLLVDFFLAKHAAPFGRPRSSLSPQTLQAFMEHSWPGNIRELENAVKKIVALGDEQLTVSAFVKAQAGTPERGSESQGHSLKAAARAASREAERELIMKALARTRWNRKRAAQELQISYKSLLYKLKQIGLADSDAN